MASIRTKFSVGLFLICGIAIAIVAIIWLGLSNYLEKGRLVVAYFDESVQGLDVDSPVKYRGVRIGRVKAINVAPDEHLIEVILMIESKIQTRSSAEDFIATLKSVGITGLKFIEIDHRGDIVPRVSPPFAFATDYPVIATQPSEISKIFQGMEDIFKMFRSLDTAAISLQLTTALKNINRTIEKAQVDRAVTDFRATLNKMQQFIKTEKVDSLLTTAEQTANSIKKMAHNADDGISDMRNTIIRLENNISHSGSDIRQITADLKTAAVQVKEAMSSASDLVLNTDRQVDTLQRQVMLTLNRVDRATETLNRFLDHISNQPSTVVFSGPSTEKPLAPGR